MRNLTPATITQAFADYAKNAPSARTRTLLVGLADHLHRFVRENGVTPAEWDAAIGAPPSSVLGPFHSEGAPELAKGGDLWRGQVGEPLVVSGRVADEAGAP